MSEPAVTLPTRTPDQNDALLRGPWWWWRLLLADGGLWVAFAPYPMGRIAAKFISRPRWVRYDAPGSTLSLVLAAVSVYRPPTVPDPAAVYADLAELLLGGVGLIAGLLGIASALPGPKLIEATLKRRPDGFVDHIRPWLFGLVMGVASAAVLFLWEPLSLGTVAGGAGRGAAAYFAWRGGFAVLGGVFYALRLYALSLHEITRRAI